MTTTAIRTNKFAATCADCGNKVAAETGILEKENGRWVVFHQDGTCPAPVAPLTPGVYRTGGQIIKLQANRETKKLYSKKLVQISGRRLNGVEEVVSFEFHYAPELLAAVTAADRLSKAEAIEFGIQYGVCCNCGKKLKDATSVAAGIGPVCIKKFA